MPDVRSNHGSPARDRRTDHPQKACRFWAYGQAPSGPDFPLCFLLANRFFNGTSLPAIYFAPAALASAPLRPTRKVRPSRMITILSSRVSQPTAQSKTGVLQPTAVLSCANDNSPFVFSAFQMSPAVVPISLCMAPPSIATPKSIERLTGSRCQLKSIVQDVENVIPVQNPYSATDGYLRSIG